MNLFLYYLIAFVLGSLVSYVLFVLTVGPFVAVRALHARRRDRKQLEHIWQMVVASTH